MTNLLTALKRMKELGYEFKDESFDLKTANSTEGIYGNKLYLILGGKSSYKDCLQGYFIPNILDLEKQIMDMKNTRWHIDITLFNNSIIYFLVNESFIVKKQIEHKDRLTACCLMWVECKQSVTDCYGLKVGE